MDSGVVNSKLRHPVTGKPLDEAVVKVKGKYRWNPVYRVYNHARTYEQLLKSQLDDVVYEEDEDDSSRS
jgi:hypothetical protein